ncbi:MAG: hypothetical protein KBB19_11585 [Giesbergeria sp.]|jgi:hypothetical protein|nr:hypothetical protein [Giesbergeria sp.]MBP6159644.1 hypothetical protein [Giesbergeria sp.]MBP7084376.1 hypothetical protein [Giesbergeria sp.]
MTDSKSPLRDGACFAALKDAILAEQHVLELDIHIVSARVKALLGEPLFETDPASAPIVMASREHALTGLGPLPASSAMLARGSRSDRAGREQAA